MMVAANQLEVANTDTLAVAALDRGWTLHAHTPPRGVPISECTDTTSVTAVWSALHELHAEQIAHGDLRACEITVADDTVLFGGFGSASTAPPTRSWTPTSPSCW